MLDSQSQTCHPVRRRRVKAAKPIRDYWTRPLMRLLDCSSVNYFELTSYVYSSRWLGRPKYLSRCTEHEEAAPRRIQWGTLLPNPWHLIGRTNDQNLAKHYLLCHENLWLLRTVILSGVANRGISFEICINAGDDEPVTNLNGTWYTSAYIHSHRDRL